jgi:hypothetical protein
MMANYENTGTAGPEKPAITPTLRPQIQPFSSRNLAYLTRHTETNGNQPKPLKTNSGVHADSTLLRDSPRSLIWNAGAYRKAALTGANGIIKLPLGRGVHPIVLDLAKAAAQRFTGDLPKIHQRFIEGSIE